MRFLAAIAFCFLVTAARAASPAYPCPSFVAGWALSGPPPITGVLYETTSQQFEMIWNYSFPTLYWPVPTSTMQTFSSSKNWQQTFQYSVAPAYEAVFLQETYNCPVLQETPEVSCYLSAESGADLLSQAALLLLTENGLCPNPKPAGFIWVN